ncbi:hypothetical protein [Amycolatopsis sp. CA-230715]|uniref:hypothetical protein n=1 Tax=Amycolatopsis sp. CA-230715 TaxID=2745196 RepID=UPI001C027E12|nr:hypothetical protein [Amycolatopsis sp. CA-230715]
MVQRRGRAVLLADGVDGALVAEPPDVLRADSGIEGTGIVGPRVEHVVHELLRRSYPSAEMTSTWSRTSARMLYGAWSAVLAGFPLSPYPRRSVATTVNRSASRGGRGSWCPPR